jgi:hypothetical protein
MPCVLHVSGATLAAEAAATSLALRPYQTYTKGGRRLPLSQTDLSTYPASGLKFEVSAKPFDDLPGQIADATAFLETHRWDLATLRDRPDVEQMILDFGQRLRIGRDRAVVQVDFLPPSLLALAGGLGIGIEVSLYGSMDDSST